MVLAPGTTLQDRYLITRQLGQGGMGAVYEAADQRLRSKVALKETFASTDNLRRAFEREAQLLANLRHSALPRVTDHFAEGAGHFLVMEYVPGEDLERQLERRAVPFPVEQVVAWADRALGALEYLHARRPPILHRDIKPANIKVTEDGDLYLLDFGLAKGSAGDMTLADTGRSVYGYSAAYAPPEQIQGLGTDARSDLYALGATLYHLVTKVAPPDAFQRAYAVSLGKPDPLTPADRLTPQVPHGISAVLCQTMALDIAHRPVSATVLRRMLANARQQDSRQRHSQAPPAPPPAPPPHRAAPRSPSGSVQTPPPPAPHRPSHSAPPPAAPHAPAGRPAGAPYTPAPFVSPPVVREAPPAAPVVSKTIPGSVYFITVLLGCCLFPLIGLGGFFLGATLGYRWPSKGWRWSLWASVIPSLIIFFGVLTGNIGFGKWLFFACAQFVVSSAAAAVASRYSNKIGAFR